MKMEFPVFYILLILPLIVYSQISNDVRNDELQGPNVCNYTKNEEYKLLEKIFSLVTVPEEISDKLEHRTVIEEQTENSPQIIRECCPDYVRKGNECISKPKENKLILLNEEKNPNSDEKTSSKKIIVLCIAIIVPIVFVINLIVLICYNRCTRTKSVPDLRHLNMNNSAWLPGQRPASISIKSIESEKGIIKETNLNQYRDNSIKIISGMFYKNVYGNMNQNSINSIHNLGGEQLECDIKQLGYDPMNPFQPNNTLREQYNRLNQLVNLTKNGKELEC